MERISNMNYFDITSSEQVHSVLCPSFEEAKI